MIRTKSMNNFKRITIFSLLILFILLIIDKFGILDDLGFYLTTRIDNHPLPRIYFPIFIGIGLFLPLIQRILKYKEYFERRCLDLYLYLLLWQIINELVLVVLIGKWIGVLVGLIFTIARLFQLRTLLKEAVCFRQTRIILLMSLFLWLSNIIQILFNRIIPVLLINLL